MAAPGTRLPLRPPAHRVDPGARWLWALQGALVTAVIAAGVLVLSRVLANDDVPRWFEIVLAVARWLLVPLALVSVVVEPLWRYRVHRWEVTADAVYTLEGWVTRTWRIVPVSRIQTVDTTRGPLQQLLGLTSISVRTASHAGSTSIEQLSAPIAAAVAHDLGLRANTIRDEAT
ncbi:MAG TPA: PH domain-containing protein [Mycobacteriales bacterium]|nr:PH domain-containing protein [Mycobacteriales bacterium]